MEDEWELLFYLRGGGGRRERASSSFRKQLSVSLSNQPLATTQAMVTRPPSPTNQPTTFVTVSLPPSFPWRFFLVCIFLPRTRGFFFTPRGSGPPSFSTSSLLFALVSPGGRFSSPSTVDTPYTVGHIPHFPSRFPPPPVLQGEPKKSRKAKISQLWNPSPPEPKSLVEFGFIQLEEWGMVLQSKIVPPARIEGDSVKKDTFLAFFDRKKIEKSPKLGWKCFWGPLDEF